MQETVIKIENLRKRSGINNRKQEIQAGTHWQRYAHGGLAELVGPRQKEGGPEPQNRRAGRERQRILGVKRHQYGGEKRRNLRHYRRQRRGEVHPLKDTFQSDRTHGGRRENQGENLQYA